MKLAPKRRRVLRAAVITVCVGIVSAGCNAAPSDGSSTEPQETHTSESKKVEGLDSYTFDGKGKTESAEKDNSVELQGSYEVTLRVTGNTDSDGDDKPFDAALIDTRNDRTLSLYFESYIDEGRDSSSIDNLNGSYYIFVRAEEQAKWTIEFERSLDSLIGRLPTSFSGLAAYSKGSGGKRNVCLSCPWH